MKLTKLQRYTAYCIMLEQANDDKYKKERRGDICLCFLAFDIFNLDILGYEGCEDYQDSFIETFPELLKKRPKIFGSYWFKMDKNGHKKRLDAIKQCIIETHPDNPENKQ